MTGLGDALKRARDERPFSNGTEGYGWMENWCDRCLRDAPARSMIGPGCPLVAVAMLGKTPAEWLDGPRDERGLYSIEDQYHCIEFKPYGGGGRGHARRPRPTPPGQEALFSRRPFEAVRMLVSPEPAQVDGEFAIHTSEPAVEALGSATEQSDPPEVEAPSGGSTSIHETGAEALER